MAHQMTHAQLHFTILACLTQAVVTGQNSTVSLGSTSTLIPIIDTYVTVVESVLEALVAIPLLILAAWTVGVIVVARALPKSNFIYYILSLAVADFAIALGDIVGNVEFTLAPNAWGGLSSTAFSPEWATFAIVLLDVGSTQHYLVMVVIASDRLYSVLRPIAYKQRGPPVVFTAVLNVFYAVNLVATSCCFAIGGVFTYSEAYNVALAFNQYVGAALVFAAVVIYAALLIAVRRKKQRVLPQSVVSKQQVDVRQRQIVQAVTIVAVVYIATALTSAIAVIVLNQLYNSYVIATGPYLAAYTFWYVLMAVGQLVDLSVFAVKLTPIAEPSAKYLKAMRVRCGCSAQADRPQQHTSTKPKSTGI